MKNYNIINPNEKFKLAIVSWNMRNNIASNADIKKIIHQSDLNTFDAIIVAAQEETIYSNESLSIKIENNLPKFNNNYRHSFITRTEKFGQVSVSVLTSSGVNVSNRFFKKHRDFCNPNKGGMGLSMMMNQTKIDFIGVHLESKSDYRKHKEAESLFYKLYHLDNHYLNFDLLTKASSHYLFMGGDFNWRWHYNKKKKTLIDPVHDEAPETIFLRRFGFKFPKPKSPKEKDKNYTYPVNTKISPYDEDKKRYVGTTKRRYRFGGILDQVGIQHNFENYIQPKSTIIEDTESSDHKPVVFSAEIINQFNNDFERTKDWAIRQITDLASEAVIQQLKRANNDTNGRFFIEIVANYYIRIKLLMSQGDSLRLRNYIKESNAIDQKNYGLAQQLVVIGDQFFEKKITNKNFKKLENQSIKAITKTFQKTPSLKNNRDVVTKILNIICYITIVPAVLLWACTGTPTIRNNTQKNTDALKKYSIYVRKAAISYQHHTKKEPSYSRAQISP